VNDRAERIHRAALHTRHAGPHSRRTRYVAHRPGIDEWLSRHLLAERAWTRRSVLGGLGAVSLAACSGGGSGSSASSTGTTTGTGGTTSGTTTGTTGSETITSTTPGSCVLIPEEKYSSALYAARGQNRTSPSQDGIFSDGIQYQVPTMTADAATGGYAAELTVGIA